MAWKRAVLSHLCSWAEAAVGMKISNSRLRSHTAIDRNVLLRGCAGWAVGMAGCMWVVAGIIVNATIHRNSWDLSTTLPHHYCEHAFDQVSRGIMVRFGCRLMF